MKTITQVKFILKQLLLLSGFVYLLSGRSIPGVTESTSVQFNLSARYPLRSSAEDNLAATSQGADGRGIVKHRSPFAHVRVPRLCRACLMIHRTISDR